VFNTPNEKSRPGYLKLGWQSAGPMTVWVRPGGRFAVRGGGGRQAFDGDALLVPDLDDGRLHTARTPAYLRWRYGEVPSLSYGIAREGDLSVVFRARARGGRDELTVCELVLPDGPAAIARSARLVRRVVRQGRESQAVAMAARGTREAAVLALAGFVPVPRSGPHLVVRRVPDGPDLGLDPALVANWRAQVGDLEVF
jgi:hypothetical protein